MKRTLCLVVALLIALSGLAYYFYTWESPAKPAKEAKSEEYDWKKFEGQGVEINVCNWGEYISIDEGGDEFDTNTEFEKLTGIQVNYTTFATNEELYAKLKEGAADYDVVIPSDYMISRMINEGMLEELELERIPNAKYMDEDLDTEAYDPEGKYSVPYMWGVIGIVYNKTLVDEEDIKDPSWDILWNEKYKGSIFMFSNPRDAFGIALMKLGYSVNTENSNELLEAAELLKEQKPLVQAYIMDEIFDKMGGGEAALAPYYAGDAMTMMDDNEDLDFVIPDEGTNLYIDAMCIPDGAPHKEAAEMYINYMCETEVALANCEYTCYSTPHTEAYELLDEDMKESFSYPSEEFKTEKCEAYKALSDSSNYIMSKAWTDLMSSGHSNPYSLPIFITVCVGAIVGINVYKRKKKKKIDLDEVEA